MKKFSGRRKKFCGRCQKFCGASNFILRESLISPQKKHADYLHLFSAGGAKTPIFVAESPRSPKNVAAD
jgi:hypothetical protein